MQKLSNNNFSTTLLYSKKPNEIDNFDEICFECVCDLCNHNRFSCVHRQQHIVPQYFRRLFENFFKIDLYSSPEHGVYNNALHINVDPLPYSNIEFDETCHKLFQSLPQETIQLYILSKAIKQSNNKQKFPSRNSFQSYPHQTQNDHLQVLKQRAIRETIEYLSEEE